MVGAQVRAHGGSARWAWLAAFKRTEGIGRIGPANAAAVGRTANPRGRMSRSSALDITKASERLARTFRATRKRRPNGKDGGEVGDLAPVHQPAQGTNLNRWSRAARPLPRTPPGGGAGRCSSRSDRSGMSKGTGSLGTSRRLASHREQCRDAADFQRCDAANGKSVMAAIRGVRRTVCSFPQRLKAASLRP